MPRLNKKSSREIIFSCWLILGFIILSCAAQGEVRSFNWGTPKTGFVRSKISENGGNSVILYKMSVKKIDSEHIEIAFSDASFETEEGSRPIDAVRVLPSLLIDKVGRYRGLRNVGLANESLLEKMPVDIESEDRENWKRKLKDPNVLKSMNQRFEGIWNTWVGSWNGLSVDQERGFETGNHMSVDLDGRVLDYEYLGLQKNVCARCVKLRCESSLSPQEASATVRQSLSEAQGKDSIILEEAGSSTLTEVVTDLESLLPYYAKTSTHVMLKMQDMNVIHREVTQEYWFDWIE